VLYELFRSLLDWKAVENLFHYITFRAAGAALTAFLACLILGPAVLAWLERHGVKERVRKTPADLLEPLLEAKKNVPTMGGILLGGAILLSGLLWTRFDNNPYTVAGMGIVLFFGALGLLDDWIKLKEEFQGLRAWVKLLLVTLGSLGVALLLYWFAIQDGKLSQLSLLVPFDKDARIPLAFAGPVSWFAWCWLVLAGTGNAVNLADGLDGLAAGLAAFTGLALAVVCYLAGRADFAPYLYIPYVPGAGEMAVLLAALVGACMGFLWFNCNPAMVFMGDTGSLPLGGLLGYAALVSRHEYILFVAGGLFVVEALSVMIQVTSFKLTGRRVFSITPIHHAFQLKRIPENRIVVRFWILGAILSMMALAMLKVR